jgi:signal transduction histidine kinase
VIKRNADYLRLLVNDLIDVSQLETGRITIDLKPTAVADLMAELESSFGPIVNRKKQRLIIRKFDDTLQVRGDHLRLLQVLSNLLGNASKYSPPNTLIMITSTVSDENVSISVIDEGERMSDADKEKAFDMFFRGTSRRATQESGTGIGLAVSKMIVEAHEGSIEILDGFPSGTEVVVTLPRQIGQSAPATDSEDDARFIA